MNTSKVTMVIALIALVLGGIAIFNTGGPTSVGGQFNENVHKTFQRGITVNQGLTNSGAFTGTTGSFSGFLSLTGATSTRNVQIGVANSVKCLMTYATDATTTPMFWSTNAAGTVVASTTAPTGC